MSRSAFAITTAVASLAAAGTSLAAQGGFSTRTIAEQSSGLAVKAPLDKFRATSKARVIVPNSWKQTSARHFRTGTSRCTYNLSYSARTVVADGGSASDLLDTDLPSPADDAYLLDEGTHGKRAYRVVRSKSTNGRIHIRALWAGVLTKRDDIVPAGKTAWTEIRVTVDSRAGDECHAGTYRDALGPDIGDSLAVARTSLRFVRA